MKILVDGLHVVGFLCETVFTEKTEGDGLVFLNLRRIG
jgi:hypothetical protein